MGLISYGNCGVEEKTTLEVIFTTEIWCQHGQYIEEIDNFCKSSILALHENISIESGNLTA
jgi:hypothetical protein